MVTNSMVLSPADARMRAGDTYNERNEIMVLHETIADSDVRSLALDKQPRKNYHVCVRQLLIMSRNQLLFFAIRTWINDRMLCNDVIHLGSNQQCDVSNDDTCFAVGLLKTLTLKTFIPYRNHLTKNHSINRTLQALSSSAYYYLTAENGLSLLFQGIVSKVA